MKTVKIITDWRRTATSCPHCGNRNYFRRVLVSGRPTIEEKCDGCNGRIRRREAARDPGNAERR